jgi:hypothetical protein
MFSSHICVLHVLPTRYPPSTLQQTTTDSTVHHSHHTTQRSHQTPPFSSSDTPTAQFKLSTLFAKNRYLTPVSQLQLFLTFTHTFLYKNIELSFLVVNRSDSEGHLSRRSRAEMKSACSRTSWRSA